MFQVDAVMVHRALDRDPSLRFNGPPRSCAAIIFGSHLRQDAIAKSERRIAKAGKMKSLQQFRIDHGTGTNDLGTPRPDTWHLDSLLDGQARKLIRNTANHLASRITGRAALPRPRQMIGDGGQGSGG